DLEQGVELGQLEERLEVIIEVGQTELPALFANLLRQRDENAQARAVDVASLAEVDEEFLLTLLELIENLLLELLTVPHDELPFDIDHNDLCVFLDRETHSVISSIDQRGERST